MAEVLIEVEVADEVVADSAEAYNSASEASVSAVLLEGLRSGTPFRRVREYARFLLGFFLTGGASGTSSGVGEGSREFMVDNFG